jgi:hypothetical protein
LFAASSPSPLTRRVRHASARHTKPVGVSRSSPMASAAFVPRYRERDYPDATQSQWCTIGVRESP